MITFDETTHTYKNNGVIIPSVTQILKGSGLVNLDHIPIDILEAKADLGTKVHTTTELYDNGTLDIKSLHPVLVNYLESWIKFRKDYDFEPTELEVICFHPLYQFIGRNDRVGLIKNRLSIIDIKTGMPQKSHAIQTAGYKILYNYDKKKTEQVKDRYIVYLSESGYKVEQNKKDTDENVFLAALTIYNYLRSK